MTNANTPFPLGAYLANPNGSDASAEATFESDYNSFVSVMGTAPQFIDSYVDYTQPVSDWISNSSWQAWSNAQSPDAQGMTPVIGLPMYSNTAGALSDQQYQAIIAGQDDSVYQGIVSAWAQQGFTNLVFRPGWEMNLTGPTYAGATAQDQADWVAAFQHIYTVLHQAAATDGVNVSVVWNPGTTNYSNAEATTNLYPGNNYVDVIGADVYADMYPYSDGGSSPTYHDWDTGKEDTTVAQFIADPVNREHYWSEPAATEWSTDGSGGHSQSLDSLIQFAEQQGKPFAVPETGAGNSNSGTDVQDDPQFPQWLAEQLTTAQTAGEKIDFVNIWDSNGGGNYQFSFPSDDKPLEAAAWSANFGVQSVESAVACFCSGTRILTDRGEIVVDNLVVGDRVVTVSGSTETIRWIGWRRMELAQHPRRVDAQPIRIQSGAFGDELPRRDLWVSPEHALYIDGVLIPARCLVGCAGIGMDMSIEATTYFHVELSRHDVVLAEGMPCESWLDTGNRSTFENSALASIHFDEQPGATMAEQVWRTEAYAPLVISGPILDAVRGRFGALCVQEACISRTGTHRIAVSPDCATVRLVSTVGHAEGDRRTLGCAISTIRLDEMPIGLTDPCLLIGFHPPETNWRWTDGAGLLALDVSQNVRILVVEVAALAPSSRPGSVYEDVPLDRLSIAA